MTEISGVLPVDKPSGISSFDVIRRISKKIHIKKIGHSGTLDMAASGVLPLLVGEATKLFDFMLKTDKIYRAGIQFGVTTATDDADGEVTARSDIRIAESDLRGAIPMFVGRITQVPPKYSALKTDGVRNYKLARRDMEVPEKPREVDVKGITLDCFDNDTQAAVITVTCSSGTYIRAIARDLGKALGCGAHLSSLIRLKSGGIEIARCRTIDEIDETNFRDIMIPLLEALPHIPVLELTVPEEHLMNGKPLAEGSFTAPPVTPGVYRVVSNNRLAALVESTPIGIRYLRVFPGA